MADISVHESNIRRTSNNNGVYVSFKVKATPLQKEMLSIYTFLKAMLIC